MTNDAHKDIAPGCFRPAVVVRCDIRSREALHADATVAEDILDHLANGIAVLLQVAGGTQEDGALRHVRIPARRVYNRREGAAGLGEATPMRRGGQTFGLAWLPRASILQL